MGAVLSGAKYLAQAVIFSLSTFVALYVSAADDAPNGFRIPNHPELAEKLGLTEPGLGNYYTYGFGEKDLTSAVTTIHYADGGIYNLHVAQLTRGAGKVGLYFMVGTTCEPSERSTQSQFWINDQAILAKVYCETGQYKLYVPLSDEGDRFVTDAFMSGRNFILFKSAEANVLFSSENFRETYDSLRNAL
ncbi:MAG: hypothetical protein KAI85_09025 [Halopseudomonas aestusnigri]|nr:hypothetical protein [Halopseudomonas aestusnigri]